MELAVIGASSGIGAETVKQAISRGHFVKALSRNNGPLPANELLTKIDGTVLSVDDVKSAIKGTDVVLVTIGTKKKKGTTLFSAAAKVILTAALDINYKGNIIIVTGLGTGESAAYISFFLRSIIRLFLKDQYSDKTLMEKLISTSQLNWEFVMPGMLTNGALTMKYKAIRTLYKGIKISKISRADVAHYLVQEAEHPGNMGYRVALTH